MKPHIPMSTLYAVALALLSACSTIPSDNARNPSTSGDPDPAVRSTGGGGY